MFERFTDRARKVMALANQEAQRFNHEYIGTEHVLLALLEQEDGDGVLTRSGVDGERVEQAVTEAIAGTDRRVPVFLNDRVAVARRLLDAVQYASRRCP